METFLPCSTPYRQSRSYKAVSSPAAHTSTVSSTSAGLRALLANVRPPLTLASCCDRRSDCTICFRTILPDQHRA